MTVVQVVEGVPFTLDLGDRDDLRSAVAHLEDRLRPRSPILEERAGQAIIRGIVGSVALRPGVTLDVAPKTEPGDDWIQAVLDLLARDDRIDLAGDRRAGLAAHRNLLDVLAAIYAERLRRALRRDGPILVLERRTDTRALLKGMLRTSRWARKPPWQKHRFPIAYQELTADNDFSRALAHVARLFAGSAASPRVRAALLTCARELRPGAPPDVRLRTGTSLRRLPSQWAAFEPAWDVAVAVLSRRTLLGAVGTRHGVSIAIEAWPLLERLLQRALDAAVVRAALHDGSSMTNPGKTSAALLTPEPGTSASGRSVVPDGRLDEHGQVVATFEAKYARVGSAWPPREHIFQAVATAAAHNSPLGVLVYPDRFEPVWWRVHGFDDRPRQLAAIGLGLFSYRRGAGDDERGDRIRQLLEGPGASVPEQELTAA